MKVRNIYPGEKLPADLVVGFEAVSLTPDLVWVIEYRWNVIGLLIGFAAHGFFFPVRVSVSVGAPKTALLVLLRSAFSAMRERGFTNFLTTLEPGEFCKTISRAVCRRGGVTWATNGVWVGGKIEAVSSNLVLTLPKAIGL
jgi:hypothetical protein